MIGIIVRLKVTVWRILTELLLLCIICGCGAHSHSTMYGKKPEEIFMRLREIINDHPESPQAEDARFGIAEYFYYQKDYHDALIEFSRFIKKYPEGNAAIFAKIYLLKIYSDPRHNVEIEKSLSMDIEKELYSRPLFLLFSEYEKKSYFSPLGNTYEVRSYTDRVEVYINDMVFYTVTP